jgi:hypothetical protein
MTEIILDDHEMIMVRIVGIMRQHANISAKVKDMKRDTRSGEEIHMNGFMAEYAFGKWKNLFVDLSTKMRSGGYDLKDKHFKFDIKTTRMKNPSLNVMPKPNDEIDIYILSTIQGNSVLFLGWCEKHEIIKEENLTNFGYGSLYSLPKEKLRPL